MRTPSQHSSWCRQNTANQPRRFKTAWPVLHFPNFRPTRSATPIEIPTLRQLDTATAAGAAVAILPTISMQHSLKRMFIDLTRPLGWIMLLCIAFDAVDAQKPRQCRKVGMQLSTVIFLDLLQQAQFEKTGDQNKACKNACSSHINHVRFNPPAYPDPSAFPNEQCHEQGPFCLSWYSVPLPLALPQEEHLYARRFDENAHYLQHTLDGFPAGIYAQGSSIAAGFGLWPMIKAPRSKKKTPNAVGTSKLGCQCTMDLYFPTMSVIPAVFPANWRWTWNTESDICHPDAIQARIRTSLGELGFPSFQITKKWSDHPGYGGEEGSAQVFQCPDSSMVTEDMCLPYPEGFTHLLPKYTLMRRLPDDGASSSSGNQPHGLV
ncbi:hypothetical protein BCR37DRAFT_376994 [Protomyces lactucae-debilis]|uniref:Uncharacterized protein n=1 Tax=Protomyces lactucae-debilis TaxID=2754530 RepID=A0A1Y2FQV5_PROLT|nr:uncharacterized protein BCR37DRAFT_376994 [Protomyces lactucae-debilis]ORY86380.1 hypothetical protein BCR37DRAFT_376994 [Protomyces lactucae-debilis]